MAWAPTSSADTSMEVHITGTGQTIFTHLAENCLGAACVIHGASGHPMADYPTNWRGDRQIMERICPHGIGHPDPDGFSPGDDGTHGCDGCCAGSYDFGDE